MTLDREQALQLCEAVGISEEEMMDAVSDDFLLGYEDDEEDFVVNHNNLLLWFDYEMSM